VNAAHPPPIVYRKSGSSSRMQDSFFPLVSIQETGDYLGGSPEVSVKVSRFQLEAGDLLLWHTDGLFESPSPSKPGLKMRTWMEKIAELSASHKQDTAWICAEFVRSFSQWMEVGTRPLPDDVTMVFAVATGPFRAG
jgi:serine phosphatase RsbU (regulator of sigma subunit)